MNGTLQNQIFSSSLVTSGPGNTPGIFFTVSQTAYYIQGPGADSGGQNIPMSSIPSGTSFIALTNWIPGVNDSEYAIAIGFQNSITGYNTIGDPAGSGAWLILWEKIDAPNVWQATNLITTAGSFLPTFTQITPFILTNAASLITATSVNNMPNP